MAAPLRTLLLADLPRSYCRGLIDLFQHIYAEAYDSIKNDPRFEEPEFRYLHGHTRRALAEAGLRTFAAKLRSGCEMRRADGFGGPEHVRVTVGRFCFTACHVESPGAFPRESHHRKQYAKINEHAAQRELFTISSKPVDADIYAILAHSEALGDKSKLGGLHFGFPNDKGEDWIEEPLSVVDLADDQERSDRPRNSDSAPSPRWKKPKDTGMKEG
jgi:hypothetical protein